MSDERLAGDVTADVLRAIRADRVADAYTRITGKPCNCGRRRDKINSLHRRLRELKAKRNNGD